MKKYYKNIVIIILNLNILYSCRLLGIFELINSSIIDNESSFQIIESEALFFQTLGDSYPNGWSLSSYNSNNNMSGIYRSSQTSNSDSMYQFIFDSLSHLSDSTKQLIGHLRAASSGATDIPNPHPFIYEFEQKTYSLIHNGTINKEILIELLTNDGIDSSWINNNPPNTYNEYTWDSDSGWINVVDSELYLLWLMKNIVEDSTSESQAIQNALQKLEVKSPNSKKNIILSNGQTMYAYRSENSSTPNLFYSNLDSFTYQDSIYIPSFISIVSQIPDIQPASSLNWIPFENESLLIVKSVDSVNVINNFINHVPTIELSTYSDTISVDYIANVHFTVNDVDGDSLNVYLLDNPNWVELNDSTITIMPEQVGEYLFRVCVNDGSLTNYVNFHLKTVNYKPLITNIIDVPNDDGGWVFINFKKSYFDNNDSLNSEIYHIERKNDNNWISVGSSAAYGSDNYIVQIPTINDSTSESFNYNIFRVIASMNEGIWFSNPDSGFSVNNNYLNNEDRSNSPNKYSLGQNFPNPFNSSTKIEYEIEKESFVNISIYDILGNHIIDIVNKYHNKGLYKTNWDSKNKNNKPVVSGMYYVIMKTDGYYQKRKMILIK